MPGIVAYGAYVPFARLARKEIAAVLGGAPGKGERAVANYDEDAVSMAVGAALGAGAAGVASVAFATTSAPYAEKQSATTIAAALDLGEAVRTAEFTGTLRAGTTALLGALDAVQARGGRALVCAADRRTGGPSGGNESNFGDGAAALVVGGEGTLADVLGSASVAREIVDAFRLPDDPFVRNWEERFGLTQGYGPAAAKAAKAALKQAGLEAAAVSKLVLAGPNGRAQLAAAKALGFGPERVQPLLDDQIGVPGAACAPLLLCAALEAAKPGETILLVDYGEGADALVLRATDRIASFKPRRTVAEQIAAKRNVSYGAYLKWRELLEMEPPRRPETPRPSATAMFRNYEQNLALKGARCLKCGTATFPVQRVCWKCGAKDETEKYRFVGRPARLTTFTADNLTVCPDPPEIAAVIDFEGGGRMIANVTDTDYRRLNVGDAMEMTFRRLYEAGGIHNYFWKARKA